MTVGNHTMPSELIRTCSDGLTSCLAQWANTVTNGMFWTFALIAFGIILYLATAGFGNKRAFGFASFSVLLGSVWLSIMGLMDWAIASVFIILGIIGVVVMIMDER